MVTYEAFADLVDEIAGSLPEAFFRDLNGGVNVKEECRIHPESLHNELIILGEYCTDPYLGRMIHIYYGSFMPSSGTGGRRKRPGGTGCPGACRLPQTAPRNRKQYGILKMPRSLSLGRNSWAFFISCT